MTKTLEFLFDFGSPNCYLAWHVIPDIIDRTGAELVITPVLLGGLFRATNNQPPFTAFANIRGKMAYEMLELRRFVARHRLHAFRMNPHFPINTLAAMRGLVAAQANGQATPYIGAILAAMWEDGLKADDPDVLTAVIKEAGLDADSLLAQSQTDAIKGVLKSNTDAAANRGVFGLPTFFVGGEMFFGKERLGQVEEELRKA
jgi:2-hydroxychromene-2-carboxylate isomerase